MLQKYSEMTSTLESIGSLAPEKRFYVSGVSDQMQPVQRLIWEIAPTDIPILLIGESGTGKEIAARQIHELSKYRELPFLKLICAALTQETFQTRLRLENEAGEKGGTSAGTLFFDEVSELDVSCQRHLLHSFPGSELASHQSLAGRILSCTTRDLESEVENGRFRSELFYRLNGVCLRLPPLRRRREDIPLLIQFFLGKYAKVFQRPPMRLTDRTIQLLSDYAWPGNIRELENVVKKIVALENEELAMSDLTTRPMESRVPDSASIGGSLKAASRIASQRAERELILQTLTQTHWNRKKAAEALQISYKSLLSKLKQIQ